MACCEHLHVWDCAHVQIGRCNEITGQDVLLVFCEHLHTITSDIVHKFTLEQYHTGTLEEI